MTSPPPLKSLLVLEFAGLAPGPFAGKLLADYGAQVLRIDRHNLPPHPTADRLAPHKRSIRINLKSPSGIALVKSLAKTADVLIDPFRPGVLEKLDLGPDVLLAINPRLIYARMAGFRKEGKYAQMAGHDINYISVSGTLSMLGRPGENPYAPGNILGDFAGGGMMCFVGILLALLHRMGTGKGQVVEANMVDGSAYLASFLRFGQMNPDGNWRNERGKNLLDGGAPFYDTYRTKDGGFMAVLVLSLPILEVALMRGRGALEPQFYKAFIERLLPGRADVPDREDRENWPALRKLFTQTFLEKRRQEWEAIFDGIDACVTPVKTHMELKAEGFQLGPPVTLKDSPALESEGWEGEALTPGQGGKEALEEWWGLKEGKQWVDGQGGVEMLDVKSRL
ncbi:CoA-transferase family III domain-containing protein [Trichophaea hybrida]|nr:CoA-transferase family III domain-containing protein [Trichophaea hybrida]